MTHREMVKAVLRGEKPEVIPSFAETPMDVTALAEALPKETGDEARDEIERAKFFDNSSVSVGFGIAAQTLSRDKDHHRYRYETGAVWLERHWPTFCREMVECPVRSAEDALRFKMPDANEERRWDESGTRRLVEAYHEAGYFVEGHVTGAWSGIYYYLTRFETILMWMGIEKEAAHALFDMTGKFSVDSARRLVSCGVDSITCACDLGTGSGLLFSPAMFREYVFPWLAQLAQACHEHGTCFHLHSHGHIEGVMDGIVEAGVDMVNPVGPSDGNDLSMFKRRWGGRITLHGGISTTISLMSDREMRRHVAEVIEVGRAGGRFFPRTESGVPPMDARRVRLYIHAVGEERRKGYR
ncbi:MAG: uroporphyrinogen decarboxylase family protein [Planctomycetota bacterium]